jgi:hypothetical protein
VSLRSSAPGALAAAALLVASVSAARAETPAGTSEEVAAAVWRGAANGARLRVRFDPGQRLIVSAALGWRRSGPDRAGGLGRALELGLLLRSDRPTPGWDVHWKRDHEIARLRLDSADGGDGRIGGALYRGRYLRQSREGTLTLPTAPPVAISLPFDIGLGLELGRVEAPLASALALRPPDAGRAVAGIVHAEVLADFWRARLPGRWLTVGLGGRYDIALARDSSADLVLDHQVAPLTAVSVAARAERESGLAWASLRLEGVHRFSSARGWEQAFRADAEAEITPLAVNDRPLALFAQASGAIAPDLPETEVRLLFGVRFVQPL